MRLFSNKKPNRLFAVIKKRSLLHNIQALFVVPVFLFVITGFVLSILTPGLYTRGNETLNPKASAAQNNTINFQARLLTNTGALVPDGNYHIEFKLYDSLAGGSSAQGVCSTNSSTDDCWWRETRTTGNLVAVKNGYISVSLGSVTPFGANIPWDQELWLTMNIGGNSGSASWNGEMSPRMRITSLPFAQAAAKLKGTNGLYDADQLVQLGPGSVQTISSTGAAVRINQTGTGALLQIQGAGSDKMTLAANGDISVAGTGVFQGASVTIGTSSQAGVLTLSDGSTNSTTIQAASTTGNLTFTLPNAYGGSGDCIVGNGAGGLSFSSTCGAGGSGSAPTSASYLTLSNDGTLTSERVLTAGTNISVSDGGANSTLTINVANSPTFSGTVTVQGATLTIGTTSQAGSLVLNDGSNNTTTLQSAAIAGNLSFTLPSGYGSSGNCLVGDGAGGLSFSGTCGSGGSDTAPVGASYLTLGLDGTLTNERVLTAGSNITINDGGANGNLTVGLTNNSLTVTAGTGLSGGGSVALGSTTTLNLANTSVSANSYGSASSVATFTVDAQGRLTAAASTPIAINGNQITSGSVAVSNGGTGATTAQGAINTLSGLTTNGDLLYYDGTNTTRLARGTNGQCLTSNGTTLVWGDCNGSGSGNYIQNTTANQNSSNFNMQSAATTSVTAKFRAIASQTADIIQIRDNTDTTTVFSVAPNGNLTAGTLNGATITGGTLSTTAVNGVTTANIVLTSGSYADPAWITSLAKSKVGLANVENTALSTWAGSSNITTLGTITSGTWQGTAVGLAYGGTGATTASGARSNLGATTVGGNLFTLTNPSAIRFIQINADNTVSTLDAAAFRTAIGAGTSSTTGTVTSVSGSGGTTGLTLTGGAITTSGTLTLGGTLAVANGGTGATTFTSNGIIYGNAGGTLQVTAASTGANQCLITATAGGAPTWGSCNAGGSGFTSLTLTGNSGPNQTINEGDSINIRGDGTVLTAVASATDTVTLSVVADSIGDAQLQYNTGQNLTTTSNVQFANITGSGDLSIQGNTTIGNATSDRLTVTSQILGGTPLVFQGATDNAYTTSFAFADPTVNQTITFPNATGTVCLTSGNCAGVGGTGDILQGGNSFTAAVTIGTNDAYGLNLETSGTTRLSIDSGGAATINGSLAVAGNFNVNTDKFTIDTSTGAVNIGASNTAGTIVLGRSNSASNTINIGNVVGNTYTQTINIGSSNIAGSTTNVTIGSAVAGTTIVQGSTRLSALTTNGFVKTSGGNGALSVSSTVALGSEVSGTLPIGNGGTGATTAANARLALQTSQASTGIAASCGGQTTCLNSIYSRDSRAVNDAPQDRDAGLFVDFKQNATNGLSDGGTYNGVLTFRPYGSSTDFSGGQTSQLAVTDNGNLWMRTSTNSTTWGTWYQMCSSKAVCSGYAPASGSANYIQAQGTTPGTAQNTNFNIGTGTGIAANFNATTALLLNGNNINTAGILSNVAYLNQANTFSSANNIFSSGLRIDGNIAVRPAGGAISGGYDALIQVIDATDFNTRFRGMMAGGSDYYELLGFGNGDNGVLEIATGDNGNEPIAFIQRAGGTNYERMRVHSNGYIGIGDSTPVSLLTVGNGDLFQVNSSGAIAATTGITSSGSYTQSGTSSNTFTGATTFSAANTALVVNNNASIGGFISAQDLLISNGGSYSGLNSETALSQIYGQFDQDAFAFNAPTSYETYNGSTWSAGTVPTSIFNGQPSQSWTGLTIPNATNRVRFTWNSFGYKFWDALRFVHSTNGNSFRATLQWSTDGTTFNDFYTTPYYSSWPGYSVYKGSNNNSGKTPYLRLVIEPNWASANPINIGHIGMMSSYGGYTALYSWDYNRNVTFNGVVQATSYTSTVATGTAPLTVTSTTKVNNLNADLLDGLSSADFAPATGGSGYVQLQGSTPGTQQTGNFNISGAGILGGTLTVAGNSTLGDAATDTTSVRGLTTLSDSSSTYPLRFGADVDLYRGAANRLDLASGDSLNIISGNLRTDNGSLAILTTAGNATNVQARGLLLGSSYDSNPAQNEIRSTANENLYLNARGTGNLYLQTADSTKLTVLNNGNVGIGTTGPDAKLDVLSTSGAQLRLSYIDGTVYTDLTTDASGNLTIAGSGTAVFINDILRAGTSGTLNIVDGAGDLYVQDELEVDGNSTIAGTLDVTGFVTAPKIAINRSGSVASGISWYNSSSFNAWAEYMGPAGTANQGPTGNITAPAGTLVTTWGLRSFIENVGGYGWTWESGAATSTTPSIVAELSSNTGNFRTTGTITGAQLISNIATGTAPLTVASTTKVNNLNVDQLDGLDSTAFALASGVVTTVGSLNGGTANANGATISGNNIYLQSASASYAGLVDTTTQTFAGAKTFSAGTLVVSNANANGINVTGTNPSISVGSNITFANATSAGSYSTSSAAGDLVIRNTNANGNIILQQGSGTAQFFLSGTNGRIGIGNISPNTSLDVSGAISRAENGTRTYSNVYTYSDGNNPSTGTFKLVLPKTWSDTMLQIKISGYDYSGNGAWEAVIGGYNYSGTSSWINTSAEIRGQAPFSSIRLAHDGSKVVILMGTTSTTWYYPKISVTNVVAGHSGVDDWGSGWSGSFIVSEAGIASINTPTLKQAAYSTNSFFQNGNSFGTTATLGTNDSQSLVLETANTARLTINSSGASTFAGSLQLNGSGLLNSSGYEIVQTNASDWLRINQNNSFTSGTAAYGNWAFGTGGISVGSWGTAGAGNIQATGSLGLGGAQPSASGTMFTNLSSRRIVVGDSDTGLGQVSDGVLAVYTNDVERMRIDAAGIVRVGTGALNIADGTGDLYVQDELEVDGNSTIAGTLGVTGNVNTTGVYQINGNDINIAGTLTNVAYENQANTFTAINVFNSSTGTGDFQIHGQGDGYGGGTMALFKNDSVNSSNNYIRLQADSNGTPINFADFQYGGSNNLVVNNTAGGGISLSGANVTIAQDLTVTGADLTLGADVVLSRGAANRLDLASGDSLNLVSGSIQQNTTTRLTSAGLFQAADGAVGGPAYSFSNSTNMGMYRIDGNNLGFSVAGTERLRVSNTGAQVTGQLTVNSGDTLFTSSGLGNFRGSTISNLGDLNGRQLNSNSDFLEGLGGYNVYDNGASGSISLSLQTDATAPNTAGRVMRLTHTAAGSPTPGWGGFYKGFSRCSDIAVGECYREGDRIVYRIWAKIPVGYTIDWASNSYGNSSSHTWYSTQAGTGQWQEYVAVQQIGSAGTFSSTGFWFISGSTRPVTWDVASVDIIDVDQAPDVARASELNVGYKRDVTLGAGQLLTTQASYLAVDGGNVGIGTINPGNKLSVVTSGQDTLPALGANGGKLSLLNDNGTYGMLAGVLSSGNAYIQAQRVDATATAYSLLLQPNGGNVSIGTTSVDHKLLVNGRAQASSWSVYSTSGDVTNNSPWYGLGWSNLTLPNASANAVQLGGYYGINFATAAGSSTMVLNQQGNLGLGTNNPTSKLQVESGSIYLSGVNNKSIGFNSSSNWQYYIANSADDFRVYDSDGTDFMRMYYNGGTTNKYVSMLSTLNVKNNGRVGIGTNNPGYKLVVDGDHGNTQFLMHSSGDGGAVNTADLMLWASEPGHSYTGVGIANNIYNTTGFPRINTNRGGSMIRLLDNNIAFTTVNTSGTQLTGMTLNGSGNLSIAGTTTVGTLGSTDTATYLCRNSSNIISACNTTGTGAAFVQGGNSFGATAVLGTNDSNNFEIETAGSTRLTVGTNGNVGLGTTGTSYRLTVNYTAPATFTNAAGDFNQMWQAGGTNILGVAASTGDTTTRLVTNNGYNLAFNVNGAATAQMTLTTAGNLGIGRTNPQYLLDVSKANTSTGAFSSNAQMALRNSDGTTNNWTELAFHGTGSIAAGIAAQNINHGSSYANLSFFTRGASGWSSKMTILSDGNVGIGDTNPAAKLTVNGNILASASSYLNFGATSGSGGYGIRDNAGIMQVKNTAGSWQNISAAVWTSASGVLNMDAPTDQLRVNGSNAYSYTTSVLVNGDLEQWNAANNAPIGYGTFWQGNSTVSRSSTHYGNVGSYSAAATFVANTNGYQRYDMLDSFDVSPGEFIEVSAYGQYSGTAGPTAPSLELSILLNDSLNDPMFFATGVSSHQIKLCNLTTSWAECRGTFQIPAGKSKARIYISTYQGNATGAITTYIDKIQAERRSVAMVGGNVGVGTAAPGSKLTVVSGGTSYTSPSNNDVATLQVRNTSNGSSAHAILYLASNSSTGGNPFISYDISGEYGWSQGVNNTDNSYNIFNNWSFNTGVNPVLQLQTTGGFINRATGNNGYVALTPSDGNIELASGNDGYSFIDFKGSGNLLSDYVGRLGFTDGGVFDMNTGLNLGGSLNISNMVFASNGTNTSFQQVGHAGSMLSFNLNSTRYVTVGASNHWVNLSVFGTNNQNCIVGTTSGVSCTSDARLKNIDGVALGNLQKIMQLQPTYYKMIGSDRQNLGLIAQNVQTVLPEFVVTDERGYLQLDYGGLVTPLIGAVQEQQAMITDAENRLTALENSIQPSSNNILDLTNGGTIQGNLNVIGNLNVTGPVTMKSLTVTDDVVIAGNLTVQNISVANITINGHIITAGNTPTTTIGTAAGTEDQQNNIPAPQVTIEGNDTSGTITIVAGANTTAGNLVEVNFSQQFTKTPKVVLTAGNEKTSELRFFRSAETGKFLINLKDAPQTNQTYQFDYFVVE